jgi:hypothetical protein
MAGVPSCVNALALRSQLHAAPTSAAGADVDRHLDLLPEAGEDRHQPHLLSFQFHHSTVILSRPEVAGAG